MIYSVLGLDPGFANLGYAVLTLDPAPRVVAFGVFQTAASVKKRNVLSVEDNVRRAVSIARHLRWLATYAPNTVAICAEAMSFPRSSSVAAKVALTWGAIASLSEAAAIPILQASPQHVKKETCGVKTATKEEVQAVVERLYPEIVPWRTAIPHSAWEHPHDALAVAHVMLQSDLVQMMRRTLLNGGIDGGNYDRRSAARAAG